MKVNVVLYSCLQEDILVNPKGLKSVVVKEKTQGRLRRRESYPKESYDSIINRLLDGEENDEKTK